MMLLCIAGSEALGGWVWGCGGVGGGGLFHMSDHSAPCAL